MKRSKLNAGNRMTTIKRFLCVLGLKIGPNSLSTLNSAHGIRYDSIDFNIYPADSRSLNLLNEYLFHPLYKNKFNEITITLLRCSRYLYAMQQIFEMQHATTITKS